MNPVDVPTTTALLAGLHEDGNRAAWGEFDRRYRPILVGFLRRMGLNEADAADVAQETLTTFVEDYRKGKYDREQGRLRSWLIGIARFRLGDLRRAVGKRRVLRGESALAALPDDFDAEAVWEAEQRRIIFEQAVTELRASTRLSERTIRAFERVVLGGEPVERVAVELELTPQEIYNAKNRVVNRLREIVQRYDESPLGA
ncbi:MAG: RNA polymerase sigma factor [Phycisphaerales bacterium]|nr:RNA polymerase sigma factor [Phycisphaerales bacterium]